ncbi:hypothetical protein JMA_08810 [Jeotgalibacillus malaysiensis]|uniref:DinB-like domain-containing protein n=1 Tax=Jeotgalibacillus malaysiensis TaxID=1508404 RepID=A0A0B5ANT7_9BACL|nr:DinB family protein [Jeotgalibacillus malaysiensis]AJD90198.1 hypothetical protein JMA_08810 [Jeotgalibacillus malaysiensis]
MNPNMLETRHELIALVQSLNEEELNTPAPSGGWTVAQVVEHLAVAEVNFLKLVDHAIRQRKIGRADTKDFSIVRDRSVKMKAQHEPSAIRRDHEECLTMLQQSRKKTELFITEHKDIEQYIVSHPRFGDIPATSVFTLIAEHENRHIDQIKEILESIK